MPSEIPINRESRDAAVDFSPLSPEELTNSLESMIGDPGSRQRLGSIGRKRAEEHFDWKDHMRRMIAILEMLPETE